MNELFLLYLWTRIGSIGFLFCLVSWISILLAAVLFTASKMYRLEALDHSWRHRRQPNLIARSCAKGFKLAAATFCVAALVTTFLPTKQDVAIIAGGWLAQKAAASDAAQEIGSKTYKLILGNIDEQLAKLDGKKAKP